MAITVTLLGQTSTGAGTGLTVSFSAIAAGTVIVAAGGFATPFGTGNFTLVDSASDAVTDSGLGFIADPGSGFLTWCKGFLTASTGVTSVTVHWGSGPNYGDMYVWAITGLSSATFDKAVQGTGSTSPAVSPSTGTLSSANEAAVGYANTSGTFGGTPGSGWTDDGVTSSTGSAGEHQVTSSTTAINFNYSLPVGTYEAICVTLMSAAVAVVEGPTHFKPRSFPSQWNLNQFLFRNTAQDFSSSAVETNPHWRPRTLPSQWNVQASLRQNAAPNAVVTIDTPPPFTPHTLPAQWICNPRLLQNTAQDFSSSAVETNPHWTGKTFPAQWTQLPALRMNAATDVPVVVTLDTPPPFVSRTLPAQWVLNPILLMNAAQDFLTVVEANPHYVPFQIATDWAVESFAMRGGAVDAPTLTVETNTFFIPRTWPIQWVLTQLLKQNTAQDFSSSAPETNTFFIPRTWPPQWNLQASLMRGTAQDFSSLPPATNPVYARYGAAHGMGMLSAIPGEIPS